MKKCNGMHCRCMEKDCPNVHFADCIKHNPNLEYKGECTCGHDQSDHYISKTGIFHECEAEGCDCTVYDRESK